MSSILSDSARPRSRLPKLGRDMVGRRAQTTAGRRLSGGTSRGTQARPTTSPRQLAASRWCSLGPARAPCRTRPPWNDGSGEWASSEHSGVWSAGSLITKITQSFYFDRSLLVATIFLYRPDSGSRDRGQTSFTPSFGVLGANFLATLPHNRGSVVHRDDSPTLPSFRHASVSSPVTCRSHSDVWISDVNDCHAIPMLGLMCGRAWARRRRLELRAVKKAKRTPAFLHKRAPSSPTRFYFL